MKRGAPRAPERPAFFARVAPEVRVAAIEILRDLDP